MHKKLFISFAILISLIFSFTICFANDGGNMVKDAADNVRNAVGGVENTVENVANNVGNNMKNNNHNNQQNTSTKNQMIIMLLEHLLVQHLILLWVWMLLLGHGLLLEL